MPKFHISEVVEESIDAEILLRSFHSHFIDNPHQLGFRGHRSSTWSLTPSLARFQQRLKNSNSHLSILDYQHFLNKFEALFRRNLLLNSDIAAQDLGRLNIWEYGQHYGLPTPLLDWSDSAYVALFFSLQGEDDTTSNQTERRALWVLDLSLLELINGQIRDHIWPHFHNKIKPKQELEGRFPLMEIIRSADSYNRRLAFQQGFFTKHVFYNSFEVWARIIAEELPHKYWDTPLMKKYVFITNHAIRAKLMRSLDKMNINSRVLFPDIKGSVEHTCNQIEFEKEQKFVEFSGSTEKSH